MPGPVCHGSGKLAMSSRDPSGVLGRERTDDPERLISCRPPSRFAQRASNKSSRGSRRPGGQRGDRRCPVCLRGDRQRFRNLDGACRAPFGRFLALPLPREGTSRQPRQLRPDRNGSWYNRPVASRSSTFHSPPTPWIIHLRNAQRSRSTSSSLKGSSASTSA